ncbi:hypothetical protein AB0D66_34390 [Streptomyces sp. NPDC048270]|uniref:hypothetical protein n=1 Tax=Streptomyces sp. NPDC048270 TaxID=3154615 RepID=UPI0033D883A3
MGQIHAAPGQLTASVSVKKATHKAALHLPELSQDQWHTLAGRLADIPQAVADLLANRVPVAIADPAHARGMTIVPASEQISFACSCPTGRLGRVCDHSAALGHAVAERLAGAASVLLTARGMSARELAALLRDRLGGTELATLPADPDGTVRADQLYSLYAHRPPRKAPPEAVLETITPITTNLDEPPAPCPRATDLEWMTKDAADRARALLTGQAVQPHDPLSDTVRLLATPEGVSRLAAAAHATGHDEATLRTMMIGYRHGGPAGAHTALAAIPTPSHTLKQAGETIRLSRAFGLGTLDIADGALTDPSAGVQVRPGLDGRWYPFTAAGAEWHPAPGASDDPADAYRAARRARASRPQAR